MTAYSIGSLVRVRDRDWVVDGKEDDLLKLRPLTGGTEESCGVYLPLEGPQITSAVFPAPSAADLGDFESSRLLRDAVRLLLRGGAGPFKSFGNIAFRPRPYQLVPLLMALRLETVRLLIADDVGVGKTIEAGLIAREFIDRGEIQRLAVICPPYLCDQWREELKNKFNLDAVIVRSNTLAGLERALPREGLSIFQYYPHIIVSIDYVKTDKVRDAFLVHCPDMIIVDEAHGCAKPGGVAPGQQKRHDFLTSVSGLPGKHLILVTATPHSGVEESFRSLLGLLDPAFRSIDFQSEKEERLAELAKHLVQRRRADVKTWLGTETPFPERIPGEIGFSLSPAYRKLFHDVYGYCRQTVLSNKSRSGFQARVRYWAALSLLRCIMSSPAAAVAALRSRLGRQELEREDELEDFSPYVMDPTEIENIVDVAPTHLVNEAEQSLAESERRKIRDFAHRAEQLAAKPHDNKLAAVEEAVADLLKEGHHPIVFCRFIATAEYVARELSQQLSERVPKLEVKCVTGALADEERQIAVKHMIESENPHVLVATDCLSEGLSLQEGFTAVVHYDLPWNPNRLEQREGRVDRFGQAAPKVKTILIYGRDNPIDAAVLKVLLRKARTIHKTLGITVPLPMDSQGVLETLLQTLFEQGVALEDAAQQMDMFHSAAVADLEVKWDHVANREKASRTRFAQRAIKPDEIQRELDATDDILGDPETVKRFVRDAFKRLGCPTKAQKQCYVFDSSPLPPEIAQALPKQSNKIAFDMPCPPDAMFVTRNTPLTRNLAEYVLANALRPDREQVLAARCGVIRTRDVDVTTTLLVLRARFVVESGSPSHQILGEECILAGFTGFPPSETWLSASEAKRLFEQASPHGNVADEDKEIWLNKALCCINDITAKTKPLLELRSKELQDAHERLRKTIKMQRVTVNPLFPPDMVSVSVLIPHLTS
ncbi:MAG: helicase-related protein [Desulfomonilaceae bacterium]